MYMYTCVAATCWRPLVIDTEFLATKKDNTATAKIILLDYIHLTILNMHEQLHVKNIHGFNTWILNNSNPN